MSGDIERTVSTTGTEPRGQGADELEGGRLVGRYVILSRLGAGGMGVVYAAYDPELDRKVAVKLLHASRGRSESRAARDETLLHEARSLARLDHPAVVTVHDVGVSDGRIFIAMEFVDGTTLGDWLAAKTRSLREILEVFVRAGRGLEAAHARGLVHRDFKPANVMVGADGRVRVMDFGLARIETPKGGDERDSGVVRDDGPSGTPAYMAPEQWLREAIDARTDQFCFCAALWEAACGERPFAGENAAAIAFAVTSGNVRETAKSRALPGWLRRVLLRGLSNSADGRHPDMASLLFELERGDARRRGRILVGAFVGLGLVFASGMVLNQVDRARVEAGCHEEGLAVVGVWNDETREHLRTKFAASDAVRGPATLEHVTPWLDAQARAWQSARTDVCLGNADGLDDPVVRERATWCLDDRLTELDSLIDELGIGGRAAIDAAVPAASVLRPVSACLDTEVLAKHEAPPAEERERVAETHAILARAEAASLVGDVTGALERAREGFARAEAIGWPPLVASARRMVGEGLSRAGEYTEAEVVLKDAYFEAVSHDLHDVAHDAASDLAITVGQHLARPDEGEVWLRHAKVARERLPDPGRVRETGDLVDLATLERRKGTLDLAAQHLDEARAVAEASLDPEHPLLAAILENSSMVALHQGATDRALPLGERALEIDRAALGEGHPRTAMAYLNLATIHQRTGDYERAKEFTHVAAEALESSFGGDHPIVATAHNNLAGMAYLVGDFEQARRSYEAALVVWERAFEPGHPDLASGRSNLALTLQAMGELDAARALHERALADQEHALGPDHADVGRICDNLALVVFAQGDREGALRLEERALAIRERELGPEHPETAQSLVNIGDFVRDVAPSRALESYTRALSIWEKSLGDGHGLLAYPLLGMAEVALARGELDEAEALAKRAATVRDGASASTIERVTARFVMAKIHRARGREAEVAAELGELREILLREGAAGRDLLEQVERFTTPHERRRTGSRSPDKLPP